MILRTIIILTIIGISFLMLNKQNDKVVFMGDSITDEWFKLDPEFFKGKNWVNKGISGQVTQQLKERFQKDVLDEKPATMVLLAGTNDIAQNMGPVSMEQIFENLTWMVNEAKSNKIKVILCSILPVYDYHWKPGLRPDVKIPALNKMLQAWAKENEVTYVDYFSSMVDERNGLKKEYGRDPVHPNLAGYKVMKELLENALQQN
jgi:lysophospholipase L1-like esterase